jgi:hypothetical protein
MMRRRYQRRHRTAKAICVSESIAYAIRKLEMPPTKHLRLATEYHSS